MKGPSLTTCSAYSIAAQMFLYFKGHCFAQYVYHLSSLLIINVTIRDLCV